MMHKGFGMNYENYNPGTIKTQNNENKNLIYNITG